MAEKYSPDHLIAQQKHTFRESGHSDVDEEVVDDDYQFSKTDDCKKSLVLLKAEYDAKNFDSVDEIINDMVSKSLVNGLKKLHTAAGYGFPELVEKYIKEERIDPNCECSFNDLKSITPLHFCAGIGPDALTDNRDKCIKILIENGANPNHLTSRNDTPLHWATKLADIKVCEELVKSGVDVNKVNIDNCTCGHGSAYYKNINILEMLIDNKLDVSIKDVSGKNILHLLCKDSIETALSPSSNDSYLENLNKQDETSSNEHKEKEKKFLNLVNKLLDEPYKMNPNEKDVSNFTPVMYSCEHVNMGLLKTLIEHNGDIHIKNEEGITSMLLAILNSCAPVVKFLLEKGFDLKNTGPSCSYITDAAYLNDVEIIKMLLDAGCDVNETKQDENGVILNPLWAACERINLSVVELLLEKGANTIIREDLKMTALHCSAMAQYESLPIVKLLVAHRCPLNLKSTQAGETPLFLACNSGYADIVEYLLSLEVDPNDSSPITRTCFQQAVFRGHKDIILLLLNKGYTLTNDDKTDLNLFVMDLYQDGDIEMLNYLLNKNLIEKSLILECIKKVHSWPSQQPDEISNNLEEASAATLSDLKLELEYSYPTSVEELDVFLSTKCNLNASNSSEENELYLK